MARKLHHLTIKRGPRTLAEGTVDVDTAQGHDIEAAARVVAGTSHYRGPVEGATVEIRDADGRKWIKSVTLR